MAKVKVGDPAMWWLPDGKLFWACVSTAVRNDKTSLAAAWPTVRAL